MFLRKIYLNALLLTAVTACTKQEIIPSSALSASLSDTSYAAMQQQTSLQTTFGLAEENTTDNQKRADMKTADVDMIRLNIFLSETSVNKLIDDYLSKGYNVQICISWFAGTLTNRGFPTPKDTSTIRAQAN